MSYRLRIAKISDAIKIADLHYSIRETGALGIFAMMGRPFLRTYYKLVLNEPNEIIICAEKNDGTMIGFNSCTLDADAQKRYLKKHAFRLACSAVSSIIANPKILKGLISRYKSLRSNSNIQYFVGTGVRGEYWAWSPKEKDPLGSVELNQAYRGVLRSLGIKEVYYEVDSSNKKVVAYHKLHHDEVVDKIKLPDGRERYIMKSTLNKN